jgi:cyclohexanone monooxygenase
MKNHQEAKLLHFDPDEFRSKYREERDKRLRQEGNEQSAHVAYIISELNKQNMQAVEVTLQGEEQWLDVIIRSAAANPKYFQECTPGYYNNEGKPDEGKTAKIASFYGGGSEAFFQILRNWREKGDMEGVCLSKGQN